MENSEESQFMDFSSVHDVTLEDSNEHLLEKPENNDPVPHLNSKDGLRSLEEIPEKYRCVFQFPFFNRIQSNIIDDALYTDSPLVVTSPTGSGKTVIFELAMVRVLLRMDAIKADDFKMVYVAPIKALCSERLADWHIKFSQIGISCALVTGDSENINTQYLLGHKIIITTPEKWDVLTRHSKNGKSIIDVVKLFMIDEVQLLNEEFRGPILEAIVSRMKILRKNDIRFVAVSATVPNVEDVAAWLGKTDEPAFFYKVGENLRPVKLKKIVLGYPCQPGTSSFKFDISLNYKLQSVIMTYSEGKPTLVFCSTRKGVELSSQHISQEITFHLTPKQKEVLKEAANSMVDSKLRIKLMNGVGCHHAGMTQENRNTVEDLFRQGFLPVLVSTSTLAMGVNLPAHLVIIKSTQHYVDGQMKDYSEGNLIQMIGRAGRPKYDKVATVVIMTKNSDKERYEKLVEGSELIESNLHRHLTEHLNAEISLQIIPDIGVALNWLRSTFLYIRILKKPNYYNISNLYDKQKIEQKLQDMCQIEINALNRFGILKIDQDDGFSLTPTYLGKLMASYYLTFETMKILAEVQGTESLSDMLMTISKCPEFSGTCLRVNDKRTLNTLNRCKNQNTIRFALPGTIKNSAMKINCLIQAVFGCLRISDTSLYQESTKIMQIGERISKCLSEYLLERQKCFEALKNALILRQCFNAQLWEDSVYVAKQLPKIGTVLSSLLVNAGKTTFKLLLEANPRDLERIINRAPPMGNNMQEAIAHLPFYQIDLDRNESQIIVTVTLTNSDQVQKRCTAGSSNFMTLLIGDSQNNIIFYTKLSHNQMAYQKQFIKPIDFVSNEDHDVFVHLISDNWVGIDCIKIAEITLTDNGTIPIHSDVNQINGAAANVEVLKSIETNSKILTNTTQNKISKNCVIKNAKTRLSNETDTKSEENNFESGIDILEVISKNQSTPINQKRISLTSIVNLESSISDTTSNISNNFTGNPKKKRVVWDSTTLLQPPVSESCQENVSKFTKDKSGLKKKLSSTNGKIQRNNCITSYFKRVDSPQQRVPLIGLSNNKSQRQNKEKNFETTTTAKSGNYECPSTNNTSKSHLLHTFANGNERYQQNKDNFGVIPPTSNMDGIVSGSRNFEYPSTSASSKLYQSSTFLKTIERNPENREGFKTILSTTNAKDNTSVSRNFQCPLSNDNSKINLLHMFANTNKRYHQNDEEILSTPNTEGSRNFECSSSYNTVERYSLQMFADANKIRQQNKEYFETIPAISEAESIGYNAASGSRNFECPSTKRYLGRNESEERYEENLGSNPSTSYNSYDNSSGLNNFECPSTRKCSLSSLSNKSGNQQQYKNSNPSISAAKYKINPGLRNFEDLSSFSDRNVSQLQNKDNTDLCTSNETTKAIVREIMSSQSNFEDPETSAGYCLLGMCDYQELIKKLDAIPEACRKTYVHDIAPGKINQESPALDLASKRYTLSTPSEQEDDPFATLSSRKEEAKAIVEEILSTPSNFKYPTNSTSNTSDFLKKCSSKETPEASSLSMFEFQNKSNGNESVENEILQKSTVCDLSNSTPSVSNHNSSLRKAADLNVRRLCFSQNSSQTSYFKSVHNTNLSRYYNSKKSPKVLNPIRMDLLGTRKITNIKDLSQFRYQPNHLKNLGNNAMESELIKYQTNRSKTLKNNTKGSDSVKDKVVTRELKCKYLYGSTNGKLESDLNELDLTYFFEMHDNLDASNSGLESSGVDYKNTKNSQLLESIDGFNPIMRSKFGLDAGNLNKRNAKLSGIDNTNTQSLPLSKSANRFNPIMRSNFDLDVCNWTKKDVKPSGADNTNIQSLSLSESNNRFNPLMRNKFGLDVGSLNKRDSKPLEVDNRNTKRLPFTESDNGLNPIIQSKSGVDICNSNKRDAENQNNMTSDSDKDFSPNIIIDKFEIPTTNSFVNDDFDIFDYNELFSSSLTCEDLESKSPCEAMNPEEDLKRANKSLFLSLWLDKDNQNSQNTTSELDVSAMLEENLQENGVTDDVLNLTFDVDSNNSSPIHNNTESGSPLNLTFNIESSPSYSPFETYIEENQISPEASCSDQNKKRASLDMPFGQFAKKTRLFSFENFANNKGNNTSEEFIFNFRNKNNCESGDSF